MSKIVDDVSADDEEEELEDETVDNIFDILASYWNFTLCGLLTYVPGFIKMSWICSGISSNMSLLLI